MIKTPFVISKNGKLKKRFQFIGYGMQIGIGIINPRGIKRTSIVREEKKMTEEKVLSIVIPVFNKWNFTKSCLSDLAQLPNNHEVIIIDNASSDETNASIQGLIDELKLKHPDRAEIKYIRNEENTFHSKACNQGFRLSTGKNVLFLNNDIRVRNDHEAWTAKLLKVLHSVGTNYLAGPTMGQLDRELNFLREANEQLSGNSYIGGWCIGGSREAWKKLDLDGTGQVWNEEFPFYFNDTDLSFRARKLGMFLTICQLPSITHFGKISAQQINIPKLYKEGRAVFLKHWSKK